MQLPEILQAVSATCWIVGVCVLLGAITGGAGYLTGGVLLLIAAAAGVWSVRESRPRERR